MVGDLQLCLTWENFQLVEVLSKGGGQVSGFQGVVLTMEKNK